MDYKLAAEELEYELMEEDTYVKNKVQLVGVSWRSWTRTAILRQAKLLEMGILIAGQSFPLPSGDVSRNLLPTISLCAKRPVNWRETSQESQDTLYQNVLGNAELLFTALVAAGL